MKNEETVTVQELRRRYNISDTEARTQLDVCRNKFNLMFTQPVTWVQYLEVFEKTKITSPFISFENRYVG